MGSLLVRFTSLKRLSVNFKWPFVVIILNLSDFNLATVSSNNHFDFSSFAFFDFRLISKKYFLPFLSAVMSAVTFRSPFLALNVFGFSCPDKSAFILVKPLACKYSMDLSKNSLFSFFSFPIILIKYEKNT